MRTVLLCWLVLTVPLAAASGQGGRCVFRIDFVGGTGNQVATPSGTNYFAGGGVRLSCQDSTARIASDSVAAYGGKVIEFIGHVKYSDTSVTMTSDRGTYFKDGERWEARGHVVTQNLQNGSTLVGPSLDQYRAIKGTRDTAEVFAVGRPTIHYAGTDAAGEKEEPYVIVGDRVRLKGNDRIWAGGKVTIDRSDFAARGDSLRLDTGSGSDGTLLGEPLMKGLGADSFALTGRRIDLLLERRELTFVTAKGDGHAVSRDLDLKADTIGLDLDKKMLVQILAWGDTLRPYAVSTEYSVRADSLAMDTPNRLLEAVRAYGNAWVGGKADSVTQERDWLSGDTVLAQFAERQTSGKRSSVLRQVEARSDARSFYHVADKKRQGPPSLDYSRGERIVVFLKAGGDGGVERVRIQGKADGAHLEPLIPKAPADSAKPDSTTRRGAR